MCIYIMCIYIIMVFLITVIVPDHLMITDY